MGATYSSENIEEVENAVKQNRYLMLKQIRESEIKLKKVPLKKRKKVPSFSKVWIQ